MQKFSKFILFSLIALYFCKLTVGNKVYYGKIKQNSIVSTSPSILPSIKVSANPMVSPSFGFIQMGLLGVML